MMLAELSGLCRVGDHLSITISYLGPLVYHILYQTGYPIPHNHVLPAWER